MTTNFVDYLAEEGVHHQFSCKKTLEQNGKFEQRHHSIAQLGLI